MLKCKCYIRFYPQKQTKLISDSILRTFESLRQIFLLESSESSKLVKIFDYLGSESQNNGHGKIQT